MPRRRRILTVITIAALIGAARPADAYVGPGAGFAFLSSFLVFFTTIVVALLSIVAWPVRRLLHVLRSPRRRPSLVNRLVIIGLDGQDPKLTDQFMQDGLLPNFRRLADTGSYCRLRTTFPSVSPVAWSSFSTGTNPGKHNIFDFLNPDRRTYLPQLSSTYVGRVERSFRLGPYRIPLDRPELRQLRKSKPYWTILGEHGIWSTILRVPVTFPPDRFYGAELSATSVPDLLGTQGTFHLYTTRPAAARFKEGGLRIPVQIVDDRIATSIRGPANAYRIGEPALEVPLMLTLNRSENTVQASIDGATIRLQAGRLSDLITLTFRAAPCISISGITRLLVKEMGEHFSMYMSPINIDPEKPAMPISHPSYYATYLAKRIGKYSTLGLSEDTWALNERVIDDTAFLEQAYAIDGERQSMFFAALDRLRHGSLTCVFDATDRIQHMFWRYLEPDHPAGSDDGVPESATAIRDLYRRNDAFVGKVLDRLDDDDMLIVMSDHGFSSFQRGVNLNSWLRSEGYLTLKEGADGTSEWLHDVDWSATKAYCLGLCGLFLNVHGREGRGIVAPGPDAEALKQELMRKLTGLNDGERGEVGIREVFDTAVLYSGPYVAAAPDLLIGYNSGYRVSWDCATGVVAGPVFEDNRRPWSGDHSVDPRLVPGVFFSNRRISSTEPAIVDVAPTALRLFGIDPPAHMDGRALL